MSVPPLLAGLTLPVIGAPLFIISDPGLVIAQCRAGIVGAFPALNARPQSQLASWLYGITAELDEARGRGERVAPYAVNLIIHPTNTRQEQDLETCARYEVPLVITSLGEPSAVVSAVHGWGGLVFHDVTTVRHARKAVEAGVDGLILVCAGAGGHAGSLSPFALVDEVRQFWRGPVALSGAISSGRSILAAQVMGADLAYMGTRFIASAEARAAEGYKAMLVDSRAADIVTTPAVSGLPANFLRPSLEKAGFDAAEPDDPQNSSFGTTGEAKAWRDVWSAGQGFGEIRDVPPVALIVARLRTEYQGARAAMIRTGIVPFGGPI
jgi:nitronate monooxygenase